MLRTNSVYKYIYTKKCSFIICYSTRFIFLFIEETDRLTDYLAFHVFILVFANSYCIIDVYR